MTRRLTRRPDEEGSALVLALFFTVIFSIFITAVITFADVGLKSSKAFRAKRTASTAADAAVETAIQRRLDGAPCNDDNSTPLHPGGGLVGGRNLVVRCQNLGVAGDDGSSSSASKPRTALLAVGSPAEGVVNGPSDLRVRGDVFSRSDMTTAGQFVVEGRMGALGNCNGPVATETNPSTSPRCANSPPVADPVDARDPDFTRSATAVPVRRTIDAGACANGLGDGAWLVPLEPGYYDDAQAFTNLTTGGACAGKVMWLKPGTYYFDFSFRTGNEGVWLVDDPSVVVVGGEANGWKSNPGPTRTVTDGATEAGSTTVTSATPAFAADDLGRSISGGTIPPGATIIEVVDAQTVEISGLAAATESNVAVTVFDPRPDLPVPGSCVTNEDEGHDEGVEIIVGGESRMQVNDGRVELCAPDGGQTKQQIALYGNAPGRFTHTLEPTAVVAADEFTEPARAFVLNEAADALTEAIITAADPDPASITLGTFRQTIPPNAIIDSAQLRIRHRETGDLGNIGLTLSPSCSPTPPVLLSRAVLGEDSFELKNACGFDSPEDFSLLSVGYILNLALGGSEAIASIDGVAVEVSYRIPETRKPTVQSTGGFVDGDRAFEIDETPASFASAPLSSAGPTSASITFTGFADPPLPANTAIDSAVLRIAHDHPNIDISVTPSFNSIPANTCGSPQPLAGDQQVFDLRACGLDEPGDLAGLSVTYTATLAAGGTGTANLDGIWLELVYPQMGAVASNAVSSPGPAFVTPQKGRVIDGNLTTADVTDSQPTVTLSLTDWGFTLPASAVVDIARLRIRHQETGNVGNVSVQPTFDGNTCASTNLSPNLGTLGDDYVDLKACGLDEAGELAEFALDYTVTDGAGVAVGDSSLDGIELQVAFSQAEAPAITTRRNATRVSGTTGFVDADAKAFAIDGITSDTTLGGADPTSRSLTLAGHDAPRIPASAVVASATLRVAHSEDVTIGTIDASVTPTVDGVACAPSVVPQNPGAGITTFSLDLLGCGFEEPQDLAGFSVTYDVNVAGTGANGTSRIDGMVLDILFRLPSLRALSGCHEAAYPGAGACALVKSFVGTDLDTPARFVVNGTIYAPSAVIDLAMRGVESSILTRGAVARHIRLAIASEGARPVIGVPPESVLFTAYPEGRHDPDYAEDSFNPTLLGSNASILVGDFTPDPAFEGGAIESAMLRVAHHEAAEVTDVSIILGGPNVTSDPRCTSPFPLKPSTTEVVYSLDLVQCGIDSTGELDGLTVTYRVEGSGQATLDDMWLDVYSGPLLRAEISFGRGRAKVEGWSVLT